MQRGTAIRLDGVTFANPALPQIRDYRALIANNPACLGAWRFDLDDYVVEGVGGVIDRMVSWKEGGPDMVFDTGTKATRITSSLLGSKVASFAAGGRYIAEGFTWDPNAAYGMIAIARPTFTATAGLLLGASYTAVNGNAHLRAQLQGGVNRLYMTVRNTTQLWEQLPAETPDEFHVVLSSCSGVSGGLSTVYSQLPDGTIRSAASDFTLAATPRTLVIGDVSTIPFIGEIDFLALFNVDLINNAAELKANVLAYAAARVAAQG